MARIVKFKKKKAHHIFHFFMTFILLGVFPPLGVFWLLIWFVAAAEARKANNNTFVIAD